MFYRHILFSGKNEKEQIEKIFDLCGTPTPRNFERFEEINDDGIMQYIKSNFRPYKLYEKLNDKKSNPYATPLFIDLMEKMLKLDPKKRISAEDAYRHEFFKEDPRPCQQEQLPVSIDDTHEFVVKKMRDEKFRGMYEKAK